MPKIQHFYQTVDLLLAVGTRLRGQETGDFAVKLPTNIIQIDADPTGQRPHLRQHLFRLRRRASDAGGTVPRIEGTHEDRSGLSQ